LYETPVELRRRIEEITSRPVWPDAPGAQQPLVPVGVAPRPASRLPRFSGLQRVASISAISGLLVLLAVCYSHRGTEERQLVRGRSEFAMLAVNTHQQHLGGGVDLGITSSSPESVSTWFADQVSFSVKLPNYQEASGQAQLYRIEGGSVVSFKDAQAAYVSYQMDREPISLLMTSGGAAAPSGGEEIISKGITFHCETIDGLKVITWSDRGLTYALVSSLRERGQQSCLVCHQGTKDSDFLEGFDRGPSRGPGGSSERESTTAKLDTESGALTTGASD